MVFQPAHLFGVAGAQYDIVHYINDEAACKERLAEVVGHVWMVPGLQGR